MVGAAIGAMVWTAWQRVLPSAPLPLRFVVTFFVFVAGPGGFVAAALAVGDAVELVAVSLAAGLVFSPVLAQVLGALGLFPAYPVVVTSLGGAAVGIAVARRRLWEDAPRW